MYEPTATWGRHPQRFPARARWGVMGEDGNEGDLDFG